MAFVLVVLLVIEVGCEFGARQCFWKGLLLVHEEPVVALEASSERRVGHRVVRRHDVEDGQPLDRLGTVERHAEANARAAVVPGDGKALKAELAHDLKAVLAHRPERVGGMVAPAGRLRSEEHTSELQSLMRISYAVFCLKKKRHINQ